MLFSKILCVLTFVWIFQINGLKDASCSFTRMNFPSARSFMSATSDNQRFALFAGGSMTEGGPALDRVDVYDSQIKQWTSKSLSSVKKHLKKQKQMEKKKKDISFSVFRFLSYDFEE